MKQETKINLRMVDNLNNVKVMKQEIKQANEIAKQDLINRSKEQSSLEKSLGKLVLIEHLTKEQQTELYNFVIKQLADQKAKIRELIKKSFPCINGICGGCNNRNGDTEFLKEFEELKL